MFGESFYHSILTKHIILFGTMFNNIVIEAGDESNASSLQKMRVPLNYGPREKHLAREMQNNDEGNRKTSIRLPRMAFDITSFSYSPQRKLSTVQKIYKQGSAGRTYMSVPYDITFQLSIMSKTLEEGSRILEQIIPYFTPEFTISAKMLENVDHIVDVPVELNSVIIDDTYDTDFESRRLIQINLDFTMKANFFGPVQESKLIKFVDIRFRNPENEHMYSDMQIQPGLTANNEPTTDIDSTIPFTDIDVDDNWDYIIQIDKRSNK